MSKSDSENENAVELRPDGWERFTRAVRAAAMSGPKHRVAPKPSDAKERAGGKGGKNVRPSPDRT